MNSRHCFLFFSCIWPRLRWRQAPLSAQTRVGEAAVVKNEVVRVAASATTPINVGDSVVRDETVRTGTDSATRLVMADSTNLSLGPNPRSSSTAPCSTTRTAIATSRSG